ncbi:16S rRNA (guanine(1207)-N(2))-methyltransferase RsmC [Buchnera aphidicola (Sitobion miscanthi)]|uniref:16S rRNA (guanine(1207)-N(2))-methyltransferase RsmC n=1 Tax=Buchnera aphidicola TaxID=9 RepID=UPI0020B886A0|nr:16S rRNA (guanine(1207)-N(2))-methyltransferase RsmC [Buchnera aphidicola]MCU4136900.1 16S rRNA (guanine(1207)-N(2))-methyltransferase RsmC [Buchnera aphidicola (Sitobion miscanthi)]
MLISKNSQLILRHSEIFQTKKVFFSGNIQDDFPLHLYTIITKINLQKKNDYISFKKQNKNIDVYNNLLVSQQMTNNCDTIIYYWPKDKSEAKFQLINIISCFPINTEIFIVGNNSSGVKSAPSIFDKWIEINKIEKAKHSILISGFIKKNSVFILEDFFKTHIWENLIIKSLPGVFGHKKIDEGSKLLVSTFSRKITGNVLDIGCGTGFLSVSLLHSSPNVKLTLVDNSLYALKCSQETLDSNKLTGEIIYSNLYSNIFKKFNLIISNPPFHHDLKTNFNIIEDMIRNSRKYLMLKGELRFVTNSCFKYDFLLKEFFKKHCILKKTSKYKVYQAFL